MWASLNRLPRTLLPVLAAFLLALSLWLVLAGGAARSPVTRVRGGVDGAGERASAARVDGISDQNLAHWDGAAFDVASFSSRPFPRYFRDVWVGGGEGHVSYARFVVPWDVMAAPRGETLHFDLFAAWLADVRWLGLTPVLAVEQAESVTRANGAYLGRIPASAESYRAYVAALLRYAASAGEPIRYLEAWNEPNNTGTGPVGEGHPSAALAAEFMNVASSLCAERGCTPIAGDFLDSQYQQPGHEEAKERTRGAPTSGASAGVASTGMGVAYEREYLAHLTTPYPLNWGFHPYAAVKYRTTQTIAAFERALPSQAAVWFTEVGAYLCQGAHASTQSEQADGVRYLDGLIDPALKVTHAFYYELKAETEEQETSCPGPGGADTSVYGSSDQARPAAQAVFGGAIPTPSPTR
jgi:hypothetical protein